VIARAFHGRLPRADWYPAHEPGLSSRLLVLPGGERARIVEGGDPAGDPVVFIHGWGCSAYFFRLLLPAVMASGRRVVALDLRGHGGSDKPRDADLYTRAAMRDFAAQALDTLALPPAHVVAHSLGGAVAIDLVSETPGRARTLTLLAPVGLAAMRCIGLMRVLTPPLVAPLVPYAVPRWTIPLVLRAAYGKQGRWASRDVDEYWAPTAEPEFALALRALLHRYSFEPRSDAALARLTLPTLVILGSRDVLVRSRAAHGRTRTLPAARSVLVPGAGHVLAEEVPDVVLREMLPHLADNS
jgi:pimeloyl-ACP methyl ester carboxylesterase